MSDPQQMTILNVDDDEVGRYTTSHVLRRAGFAVLEAATGSEALDLARAAHPHLIILDVNLPDMSGFEVCRLLKADPATAAIPVLHLSATFVKSEDRANGLENGADAYLVQPVEEVELLATVRALLRLRRAEEALRRSETLAQRLLQTAPDAIVVVDGDGRIVLVNAQTERLFGYSQEELCGGLVDILLPERLRSLHTVHRATYTAAPYLRAMETGIDLYGRRKDGSEFPIEVSLSPLETPEGRLIISIIRDITVPKQREEALHNSEHMTRLLLDNVPVAIAYVDKTHRYRFVNRLLQEWFSLPSLAIVGKQVVEVVGEPAYQVLQGPIDSVLAGTPVAFEGVVPYSYGGMRHVNTKYVPHIDEYGDVLGYFALVEDTTGRRHLEEQVRQMQKMEAIGALAGGIAHDFNNVLSAIMIYTQLMLHDVPHSSRVEGYLQKVLTAGEHARDLVQHILTFSRQSDQERKPILLHVLVKEVLQLLRATLPTTIEIRQVINSDVGTIMADPTQMQQALMNLCVNAEHAMRESGGRLEIGLDALEVGLDLASVHPALVPGSYIRLRVQDTGHGMPPEILTRIFEPFFTTKGVGEGTGMGLAMVHGIVTGHGGTITVESTPGEGTTFTVYLPRIADRANAATPLEELVQGGQECILLVDDEELLAQAGQAILTQLGYTVVMHTSSVEALEVFRTAPQRYDLVITDQTMPNLTGEALVRELRRLRPDIPIILCTGFSHTMTQEKARLLGINAFLMKPLTIGDLGQTIREVLTQRSA